MTASQWEQYVAPAMHAMLDCDHNGIQCYSPKPIDETVRAVLAAVGPRIAEDTRDRLIAAAGKAVEREQPIDVRAKIVADLRFLAAARKDYCQRCPEHQGDMHEMGPTALAVHEDHSAAAWLADILEGTNDAKGWLPSWRWDDWEWRR